MATSMGISLRGRFQFITLYGGELPSPLHLHVYPMLSRKAVAGCGLWHKSRRLAEQHNYLPCLKARCKVYNQHQHCKATWGVHAI